MTDACSYRSITLKNIKMLFRELKDLFDQIKAVVETTNRPYIQARIRCKGNEGYISACWSGSELVNVANGLEDIEEIKAKTSDMSLSQWLDTELRETSKKRTEVDDCINGWLERLRNIPGFTIAHNYYMNYDKHYVLFRPLHMSSYSAQLEPLSLNPFSYAKYTSPTGFHGVNLTFPRETPIEQIMPSAHAIEIIKANDVRVEILEIQEVKTHTVVSHKIGK